MFVIHNISTGHMEKGIIAGVAVGGPLTGMYLEHPTCRWIQGEACCSEEN